MADTSKSEKLASARKKFAELKKKKQEKNAALKPTGGEVTPQFSKENTPINSMTSSTHSSVNEPVITEQTDDASNFPDKSASSKSDTAQLPNYFNNFYQQEPASFFDHISSDATSQDVNRENNQSEHSLFNYPVAYASDVNTFNNYSFQYDTPFSHESLPVQLEANNVNSNDLGSYNNELQANANTYFTDNAENNQVETLDTSLNQNLECNEDNSNDNKPSNLHKEELILDKESDLNDQYNQSNQVETHNSSLSNNFSELSTGMNFDVSSQIDPSSQETLQSGFEALNISQAPSQEMPVPVVEDAFANSQNTVENQEVPSQAVSSMESLLQLSNQMAQLIEPNIDYGIHSEQSELEKRNLELAAHLEKEKINSEQLASTINEYQKRIVELETELRNRIENSNITEMNEIGRLRQELQSHIQTIGLLVAEKTEISANANQYQITAKQKTTECEELQNRLKASRSRVADLEKELCLLKSELSQYRNSENERSDHLNELMLQNKRLNEEKEEIQQDLLELREKLKTTSENNMALQKQVQELNSQLSLANIKIQQLTTTENQQIDGQVEKLTQEKFALEKQVSDLTLTLKTVTKERDDSSSQYQQYTQQLNAQLANLAKKLEQLQSENESLVSQEQHRVRHISELERQLQNLQNDHVNFTNQKNTSDYKKEYLLAQNNFHTMQAQKEKLEREVTKVSNEKEMLLKDLESKKQSITHLENLVEQLRENQPDSTKLVAAMESDKVAAARAMSQNIELKKQLEGMQEVLLKLNNDKVELTEKLAKETKLNEDIMEDLRKTKLQLGTLADAIEIKDRELSQLRNDTEELVKETYQQTQLTDRLRHYEAQSHSSQALQEELQQAKNTISQLTSELENLKSVKNSSVPNENEPKLDNLNPQIETNLVINELQNKILELEARNKELELQLQNAGQKDSVDASKFTTEGQNGELHILDKEAAMKHLEEKFLHTMDEIARLTDEKQRLEHLVLQLQGETETIGEYVALYQYQRSILKQRAIEKDQQLKQLANDRLQIKNKLEQLNSLVNKLVREKGTVTTELLQEHENLNRESHKLCEEHSKIHQEINKITQDNLNTDTHLASDSSTDTANQIMVLLSEIKKSNLVQPDENFHHCPWCTGQLITV